MTFTNDVKMNEEVNHSAVQKKKERKASGALQKILKRIKVSKEVNWNVEAIVESSLLYGREILSERAEAVEFNLRISEMSRIYAVINEETQICDSKIGACVKVCQRVWFVLKELGRKCNLIEFVSQMFREGGEKGRPQKS